MNIETYEKEGTEVCVGDHFFRGGVWTRQTMVTRHKGDIHKTYYGFLKEDEMEKRIQEAVDEVNRAVEEASL